MASRRILATAAMAAALTTGGVVGALVGTPVMSGAQEDTTTTAPATDPGPGAEDVVVATTGPDEGAVFTGTGDGVIWRVAHDGRKVDEVARTGGRPLGIEMDLDLTDDGWTRNALELTEPAVVRENARLGREMTAEDVKYSFERLVKMKSARVMFISPIRGYQDLFDEKADEWSGIEVLDKYTVRFTLDMPYAPFLAALTYTSFGVVPKEDAEKLGKIVNALVEVASERPTTQQISPLSSVRSTPRKA